MSVLSIRPLGLRESLLTFEVSGDAAFADTNPTDIREAFVLWNSQGQPHAAYPEMTIDRPMTGREVMEWQQQAWARHVAQTRRLFGAAPLSGVPRPDRPLRGLLAFPLDFFSDSGRWTLAHKGGWQWFFTPAQLRNGTRAPIPPSRVSNGQ